MPFRDIALCSPSTTSSCAFAPTARNPSTRSRSTQDTDALEPVAHAEGSLNARRHDARWGPSCGDGEERDTQLTVRSNAKLGI